MGPVRRQLLWAGAIVLFLTVLVFVQAFVIAEHGFRWFIEADRPRHGEPLSEGGPEATLAPVSALPPPTPEASPPEAGRAAIRGRTLDAEGAPIAGASVAAAPKLDRLRPHVGPGATGVSTSDGEGRFSVAVELREGTFRVLAHAPGFAPSQAEATLGTPVDVVLEAGATIEGRVGGPDGAPIAGASVAYQLGEDTLLFELATTSAADGTYRLPGVRPDASLVGATIDARAHGFAPWRDAVPAVRAGETRRLDIDLGLGAILVGKVIDAETRQPLGGARVWMTGTGQRMDFDPEEPFRRRPTAETRSARDGTFRLTGIPATGSSRVPMQRTLASREGYVDGGTPFFWQPVEGKTVTSDIALWPAAAIEGRVLDAAGAPAAGARVSAFVKDPEGQHWGSEAVSDVAGAFRLAGVVARYREESEVDVHASRGLARASAKVRVRAGATSPAELRLAESGGRVLEVEVSLPDGGPAVGARVVRMGQDSWALDADRPEWMGGVPTTTDARGRARLPLSKDDRPFDPQVVGVRVAGHAPTIEWVERAGTDGVLRLRLDPVRALSGRVVYSVGGRPARGALVTAWDGGWSERMLAALVKSPSLRRDSPIPADFPARRSIATAIADDEGRFRLDAVPMGRIHLSARARPAIGVPQATAILRDAPEADAVLTLLGEAPAPSREVAVSVFEAEETTTTRRPLKATLGPLDAPSGWPGRLVGFGRVRFDDVTPGTYRLVVEAPDRQPYSARLEVPTGSGTFGVEVRLSTGVLVSGRIQAIGDPIPYAEVLLVPQGLSNPRGDEGPDGDRPNPTPRVHAKSDGSFELRGLAPGRYRTAYSRLGPHAVYEPVFVDVPDQSELRIVVKMGLGFRLRAPTSHLQGEAIEVVDANGHVRHREKVAEYGDLQRQGGVVLPPGTYRVRWIAADGAQAGEREVILDSDKRVEKD